MNPNHRPATSRPAFVRFVIGLFCVFLASLAHAAEVSKTFDIPAGLASSTLKKFAAQASGHLLYSAEDLGNVTTNAVKGEMTPKQALDTMVKNTSLVATQDSQTGALAVRKETEQETKNGSRAIVAKNDRPEKNEGDYEANEKGEKVLKLQTFEVMGSKLLNMDLPRTRDDAQPYVVFDRTKIEQSGAINLEDFLKNRLPMNTQHSARTQVRGTQTYTPGSINLRGLGTNQTLILVDGRRVASSNDFNADPAQPAINGYPMAAIERVEVLPTTASAIYGGSATGGVINIILRHDYSGGEVRLTYDNSFDSDTALKKVDFAVGLNFRQTNLLISGSYSSQNSLAMGDRDFYERGIALSLANLGYLALSPGGGVPPIGSTPNIASSDGSPLLLLNGTSLKSPITFIPSGYQGTASDGGAAMVANAGKYNLALADSAQIPASRRVYILPPSTTKSISGTLRHSFSSYLQAFIEGSVSEDRLKYNGDTAFFNGSLTGIFTIPAGAPSNPFQQAVKVSVPSASIDNSEIATSKSTTRRLAGGLIVKLPAKWQAEADYTWSQSESTFATAFSSFNANIQSAIADGSLPIFRDTLTYPVDFAPFLRTTAFVSPLRPYRVTLKDASLRVAGPVPVMLPGGELQLNALLEHRTEAVGDAISINSTFPTYYPGRLQSVDSAYLGSTFPLVSERNNIAGVKSLEFQAIARRDDYTTHGASPTSSASATISRATNKVSSTDPMVAMRYQPIEDITLRASYGTGFLPPAVGQLVPGVPFAASPGTVSDPLRGNTLVGVATVTTGGNANLRPEESKSFSVGVIMTPRVVPGLRLSIDYTKIDKKDNIATPSLATLLAYFPERITRGPNLPTDQPGWAGPVIADDTSLINIAKVNVEAYDIQLDYNKTTDIGMLEFYSGATWQPHYKTQAIPNASFIETAGVDGQAVAAKLKVNAGITWKLHGLTLGWNARYFGSMWLNSNHTVVVAQGSATIQHQIYHDLFASIKLWASSKHAGIGGKWGDNMELTIGLRNVTNAEPPIRTGGAYYDTFGDPRLASYWLSLKTTF